MLLSSKQVKRKSKEETPKSTKVSVSTSSSSKPKLITSTYSNVTFSNSSTSQISEDKYEGEIKQYETDPKQTRRIFDGVYEQWGTAVLQIQEEEKTLGSRVDKVCQFFGVDCKQRLFSEAEILNASDINMYEIEKNFMTFISSNGGEEDFEKRDPDTLAQYKKKLQDLRRWFYNMSLGLRYFTNLVSEDGFATVGFSAFDFTPLNELRLKNQELVFLQLLRHLQGLGYKHVGDMIYKEIIVEAEEVVDDSDSFLFDLDSDLDSGSRDREHRKKVLYHTDAWEELVPIRQWLDTGIDKCTQFNLWRGVLKYRDWLTDRLTLREEKEFPSLRFDSRKTSWKNGWYIPMLENKGWTIEVQATKGH